MKSLPLFHITVLNFMVLGAPIFSADTIPRFNTVDKTQQEGLEPRTSYVPQLDPKALGPAEADPKGNWGSAVAGLRLSLRFEKEAFQKDEPVTAIVLIRNVTETNVHYIRTYGHGEHSPICDFVVTNEATAVSLEGKRKNLYFGSYQGSYLLRRRQDLFLVRLDRIFDFRPGRYSVQAIKKVPVAIDREPLWLTSGIAQITIVE